MTNDIEPWPEAGEFLPALIAALPGYLLQQRWYPGKIANTAQVNLRMLTPLKTPDIRAALAVWRAVVPDMAEFDFFLPIARCSASMARSYGAAIVVTLPEGDVLVDALALDPFIQALLQVMASAGLESGSRLAAGHTQQLLTLPKLGEQSVVRSDLEQSNTSVRLGEVAVLKIFRKLEAGIHPELEMGRYLTEVVDCKSTAPLLGWLQFHGLTVAVLQSYVRNAGDGWSWVQQRLTADPIAATETLPWIRTLGTRTAELHQALARPTSDSAFMAEPARSEDWDRWLAALEEMIRELQRAIEKRRGEFDGNTQFLATEFDARLADMREFCRRIAAQSARVPKLRHHGDYHLGQVLVSGGEDVTVVDFEGEPSRSVDERRAKHIPLRDVAGMLRSFGYAAAVASTAKPQVTSGHAAAIAQWVEEAKRTFLTAYFAALQCTESQRTQADELVRFFCIERALYEVLYELRNRPPWVSIPLAQHRIFNSNEKALVNLRDQEIEGKTN